MNKCEVGLVKISISVYPIELLVRKSKKIDNAGSGGIFASVDYENGIVQSDAIDFRGNHYNFHPDTNAQIVGFRLPEWQRAQSFINDLAFNIKRTTLVSWDIAYSEIGWTLVEANDNGAWRVMQSNNKVGLKAILYSYMDITRVR